MPDTRAPAERLAEIERLLGQYYPVLLPNDWARLGAELVPHTIWLLARVRALESIVRVTAEVPSDPGCYATAAGEPHDQTEWHQIYWRISPELIERARAVLEGHGDD